MKSLILLIFGSFASFITYLYLPTIGEGIINILIGIALIDLFSIISIISFKTSNKHA